jgi:hypothetical protein
MRVGFAADGVGEPLVVVADEAPDAADVDVSGTITGGSDDTGGGAAVVVGGGGGGGLPSTVTVPIATRFWFWPTDADSDIEPCWRAATLNRHPVFGQET